MILRTPDGIDHLALHWPNDTPNERVTMVDLAWVDDEPSLVS